MTQYPSPLDAHDHAILRILSTQGRLPVTQLAAQIGLSKTPCLARLRRLEDAGFILGYQAILNHAKLGQDHIAFVEVKLNNTTERALSEFNAAILQIPEIEQCHMIAGAFDYLLKIRCRDMASYRHVLGERVSALPHVANTSTHVSMEAVKEHDI